MAHLVAVTALLVQSADLLHPVVLQGHQVQVPDPPGRVEEEDNEALIP